MENQNFGLGIDDKSVKLFAKYLGFGDINKSNIWFIGFEEGVDSKLCNIESIKKKIEDEKMILNDKQEFQFKSFEDIYKDNPKTPNDTNCKTYKKYLEVLQGIDSKLGLNDVFLGEVYFLPCKNRTKNYYCFNKTYGKEFKSFYKKNRQILKDRLFFILKTLKSNGNKKVFFGTYSNDFLDILREVVNENFQNNIDNNFEYDLKEDFGIQFKKQGPLRVYDIFGNKSSIIFGRHILYENIEQIIKKWK